MSAPTKPPDLLDLKMMPAWVNEPARTHDYANYEGETERPSFPREGRGPQRGRDQRPRGPKREGRDPRESSRRPGPRRPDNRPTERRDDRRPPAPAPQPMVLPDVAVRFIPHPPAFESVIAQIKSGSVTYSVFALARLFLDKPERYDVQLKAADGAVLYQLGETGAVATDQRLLEASAFAQTKDDFYSVTETQTEPLKGNFTNVARDRLSGTLLGPTNHHGYQPALRGLYEQRFSRRMSFPEFQRQIEIVSDPAVVEQWKEQARSLTTYTTKNIEPPITFNSLAEAERHFRQAHLPTLLRSAQELTISGVMSRRLGDRGLGRLIENTWAAEIRSPSRMMQELAGGLRGAGLNIFRHRKGMLFVSPFRIRTFGHERTGVSASINGILEKLAATPGMTRKQLAEKMAPAEIETAEADRTKLALASDLHWLISEGYVIEFNDGTLDLPRTKQPAPAATTPKSATAAAAEPSAPAEERTNELPSVPASAETTAELSTQSSIADAPLQEPGPESTEEQATDGGITVEQSIEPIASSENLIASEKTEASESLPSGDEKTAPGFPES